MSPLFDDCHGNALADVHREKAAVVVFRAVLAHQPRLAPVQPTAFQREEEVMFHPAARRDA